MTLFHVRGVPVRLHVSFVLLAAIWIASRLISGGIPAAWLALSSGVVVFGSVILHELGHATVAARLGIPTRDVTLYPFGGIASLTRDPRQPGEELLIALAGPAVNLLLALLALVALAVGAPGAGLALVVNLGMGVFNLLPAFPMDGGRVLRAWLARSRPRGLATAQVLAISRWIAWAFVALGLLVSPSLLLVGGFLLYAGWQERAHLQRERLREVRVQVVPRAGRGWAHPVPRRW